MTNSFGSRLYSKAMELKFPPQAIYNYDVDYQRIEGCTDDEIRKLMDEQQIERLPQIYLEYLKYFGKRSGDIFTGLYSTFNDILPLKREARSLCAELKIELPEDAFVFLGQQGHTFWYFLTNNISDNPAVYIIFEMMDDEEERNDFGLPYEDEHGMGWETLAAFLAEFIREREGESAYQKFLNPD